MIIESELRAEIVRAVARQVSLDHLYEWVMERNWNAHKDRTPAAADLAADVEILIFESSDGNIDEAGLLLALAKLAEWRDVAQNSEPTA